MPTGPEIREEHHGSANGTKIVSLFVIPADAGIQDNSKLPSPDMSGGLPEQAPSLCP